MRSVAVAFLFISSFCYGQNFQKKFPLVDRYIDSLMKDWNIPGLALGIVYKDQLVYQKGYGYRDLERKLPVEPITLFPIASNTKLFTATAACMLADEGKLNLDKPARNYLPELNFSTDELNTKVTLRDMLSHRTGLPRYDAIWVASPFNRKETAARVVYMKPQTGFREGYIYNNVMYAAAGAVMESVTGVRWEEIIRKRIFQPLDMKTSCFTNAEMTGYGNYALCYREKDSTRKLLPVTFEAQSDALGAAGIIKSNVEDMSHWMIAQLNAGKFKGQQAIPADVIKQTLVPQVISDKQGKWDEQSNALYALGRIIQTYKGYKTTMHTGSIDGFCSNLLFIPKENLGIFIVFNAQEAGILRAFVGYMVVDRLLGLPYTPWSERLRKDYQEEKTQTKKSRDSLHATQVQHTTPSHSLGAYAGTYTHPVYGEVTVELKNNELLLSFRNFKSPLQHFHYDQFFTQTDMEDLEMRLSFTTNGKGEIDMVSMQPFGDPATTFVKKL